MRRRVAPIHPSLQPLCYLFLMAGRKENPINDIVDTVGAWLGGNRGTINPQVQRTISQTKEVGKVVDQFATGGMGQALVSDAQRMAATGSSTPSALYKTAAVNLGAAAAGYGAAKVAGKVVQSGRVVNPVAAARNLVKGEKVVIHGTPNKLQGKFIEPRAESWGAQELGKPVVYNFDPRAVKAKSTIPYRVQEYANPSLYFDPTKQPQFNAVIGRTPKSSVKTHSATGYMYSESPVSIDKVVKTNKPPEQLAVELQRELRKMGTQMRGTTPKQAVKDAIARRQIRKRPPQPRT